MKVKNRACEFNATFSGIISLLKGSKEGRKISCGKAQGCEMLWCIPQRKGGNT